MDPNVTRMTIGKKRLTVVIKVVFYGDVMVGVEKMDIKNIIKNVPLRMSKRMLHFLHHCANNGIGE